MNRRAGLSAIQDRASVVRGIGFCRSEAHVREDAPIKPMAEPDVCRAGSGGLCPPVGDDLPGDRGFETPRPPLPGGRGGLRPLVASGQPPATAARRGAEVVLEGVHRLWGEARVSSCCSWSSGASEPPTPLAGSPSVARSVAMRITCAAAATGRLVRTSTSRSSSSAPTVRMGSVWHRSIGPVAPVAWARHPRREHR
jgi:hypothetical protein